MIRKNELPDIWGDQWKPEKKTGLRINLRPDEPSQIIITDDEWLANQLDDSIVSLPLIGAYNMDLTMRERVQAELYLIQGISTPDQVQTRLNINMQQDSSLHITTVTLGGLHVRNNIAVRMQGEGCHLEANGLYLVDRSQQCDNYIFVEHARPHCQSTELYKGIIDDAARARFNGHVLVQDGAAKTEAYMTNRNILLTDKAHVDTRPFLEIYNDDVKCSHGSTIGQLDEQALFYLRSRCIGERTAITMLSYAFCDEVVRQIGIPLLRDTIADMVKKRLHGELSPACDECSIPCSSPCNGSAAAFPIDVSRL